MRRATPGEWHYLKEIRDLCRQAVVPGTQVTVREFFMPPDHNQDYQGWIEFVNDANPQFDKARHSPGIPLDALVAEKVQPIAAWIIRQANERRPEWFQ